MVPDLGSREKRKPFLSISLCVHDNISRVAMRMFVHTHTGGGRDTEMRSHTSIKRECLSVRLSVRHTHVEFLRNVKGLFKKKCQLSCSFIFC